MIETKNIGTESNQQVGNVLIVMLLSVLVECMGAGLSKTERDRIICNFCCSLILVHEIS